MQSAPLCPPILNWHLLGTFLRTTALCIAAFLSIYLIVEFFEHFDDFLEYNASVGATLRYFLFRTPMFVTRVTPMAVLAGILLGLGNLARHNEFVALRAAGVSIWQVASGLLVAATLISGFMLFWNERLVPYCSQRAHGVYATEIKKRRLKGNGRRHVWYRGLAGFYNITHVSEKGLVGLTVYEVGSTFEPRRVIEVDRATWNGDTKTWRLIGSRAYRLYPDGRVTSEPPNNFEIPEPPSAFLAAPGEAEEFSFAGLQRYITDLRRKGADPSEYYVELHLKLAVPFASLVMVLIGIPLTIKGTRTSSLAGAVSFGLAIGFSYWMVLAFAKALGQNGALHPVVAAWAANGIFGFVGLFLFLGED